MPPAKNAHLITRLRKGTGQQRVGNAISTIYNVDDLKK